MNDGGLQKLLRRLTRLRWLALVFACAGLQVAEAAPTNNDQVIVPNSTIAPKGTGAVAGSATGSLTLVGILLFGGAGAWVLWRARAGGANQFSRVPKQLNVEETRSLGNRQFLVVASYQDKKFLIGVCPGRIDMLSTLHSATTGESEKVRS